MKDSPIRLEPLHKSIHGYLHHILAAGALRRPFAVLYPPGTREVGRLGTVEPVIKTRVVPVGERNHDFPLFLRNLITARIRREQKKMVGGGSSPYYKVSNTA